MKVFSIFFQKTYSLRKVVILIDVEWWLRMLVEVIVRTLLRGIGTWQLCSISVINETKGNQNNLSLRYDKLGVGTQHKGIGLSVNNQ